MWTRYVCGGSTSLDKRAAAHERACHAGEVQRPQPITIARTYTRPVPRQQLYKTPVVPPFIGNPAHHVQSGVSHQVFVVHVGARLQQKPRHTHCQHTTFSIHRHFSNAETHTSMIGMPSHRCLRRQPAARALIPCGFLHLRRRWLPGASGGFPDGPVLPPGAKACQQHG